MYAVMMAAMLIGSPPGEYVLAWKNVPANHEHRQLPAIYDVANPHWRCRAGLPVNLPAYNPNDPYSVLASITVGPVTKLYDGRYFNPADANLLEAVPTGAPPRFTGSDGRRYWVRPQGQCVGYFNGQWWGPHQFPGEGPSFVYWQFGDAPP